MCVHRCQSTFRSISLKFALLFFACRHLALFWSKVDWYSSSSKIKLWPFWDLVMFVFEHPCVWTGECVEWSSIQDHTQSQISTCICGEIDETHPERCILVDEETFNFKFLVVLLKKDRFTLSGFWCKCTLACKLFVWSNASLKMKQNTTLKNQTGSETP